jgi:hypothetical protein
MVFLFKYHQLSLNKTSSSLHVNFNVSGALICACGRSFKNSGAMQKHRLACKSVPRVEPRPLPKKLFRRSYTARQKLDVCCEVFEERASPDINKRVRAQVNVAERRGIAKGVLSKWLKVWIVFLVCVLAGQGGVKHVSHAGRRQGKFQGQEDELFAEFIYYREFKGRRIRGWWLRLRFFELLKRDQPKDWDIFNYSNGWLGGFQRRYGISSQLRSNKKHLSQSEKLERIRKFHRFFHDLQNSGEQRCPDYGRFPGHLMFHVDQVPLPFVLDSERTLNRVGTPAWIY